MTRPVVGWRSRRGAAVASALLGVALLIWMGARPGTPSESVAAGTPARASILPSRPAIVPDEPVARSPGQKGDRTFAATAGLPSAGTPEAEKRTTRRQRAGEARGRAGHRSVPDVFRTPGF